MKKVQFALVALALVLAGTLSVAAMDYGKLSGKKLVVGTMPNVVGVPVIYAQQQGYFKDAGLNVEIIIFATGAPINEAMGADELDVAVTGPAAVYGLATGRYKYIGDGMMGLGGEILYARQGSKFASGEGTIKGVKGNAAALKNAYILGPLSTTAHLAAIKYVESFGLTADDFNMVSMDHPQAYQAFVAGQGDIVSSTLPFSSKLAEDGYFRLADLTDFTGPVVEVLYTQNSVFEKRRADLLAFLDCYHRACGELVKDVETRKKVAMKFYADEGRNYSNEDMAKEIEYKTYSTFDTLLKPEHPFGNTMVVLGEFFTIQGMIDEDMAPNIPASIDDSLVRAIMDARK